MQLKIFTFPHGVDPINIYDARIPVETYKCMPDGNCLFVVQDIDNFVIRIGGPVGSFFEPEAIKVKIGKAPFDCESLKFKFNGFRLEVGVKVQTTEGVRDALPGYQISLMTDLNSLPIEKVTNEQGIAIFSELQPVPGSVYITELKIPQTKDAEGKLYPDFSLDTEPLSNC